MRPPHLRTGPAAVGACDGARPSSATVGSDVVALPELERVRREPSSRLADVPPRGVGLCGGNADQTARRQRR
jgi:hypothetical protein